MFGCLAVYVKEKIVLILRDKTGAADADTGSGWRPRKSITAACVSSFRTCDHPDVRNAGDQLAGSSR
jgi:hypothetical protein